MSDDDLGGGLTAEQVSAWRDQRDRAVANTEPPKGCSCHPDDREAYGIGVCPRRHAVTDCRIAALTREVAALEQRLKERTHEKTYHFNVAEQLAARVRDLTNQLENANKQIELWRGRFNDALRSCSPADQARIRNPILLETLKNDPPPISAASYCPFCDLEFQLHEDAIGFHHVVKGERVDCKLTDDHGEGK